MARHLLSVLGMSTQASKKIASITRALFIVHQRAGVGHSHSEASDLGQHLALALPGVSVESVCAEDHAALSRQVAAFLAKGGGPAAIIVGGGSGSLRAALDAVCAIDMPGPDRVRLATLRMGSGNVLARRLGASLDPQETLRGIAAGLSAGRCVPVSVMRCQLAGETHYGAAMVGLGQLGQVPADVKRWRKSAPKIFTALTRLWGLERQNHLEYALSFATRTLSCALNPARAEEVEISGAMRFRGRLLAGLVMNGPVEEIKLSPDVDFLEEALSFYALGLPSRHQTLTGALWPQALTKAARRTILSPGEHIMVRLLDREQGVFFLDEDPMTFSKDLTISSAGSLAFVPCCL